MIRLLVEGRLLAQRFRPWTSDCISLSEEWSLNQKKKYIAIEYGHLQLIYPLKMVIFHSYVSLPEGKL